eukprot:COSAG02_NODE_7083_length_3194_cov_2.195800_2_plen_152_part_00
MDDSIHVKIPAPVNDNVSHLHVYIGVPYKPDQRTTREASRGVTTGYRSAIPCRDLRRDHPPDQQCAAAGRMTTLLFAADSMVRPSQQTRRPLVGLSVPVDTYGSATRRRPGRPCRQTVYVALYRIDMRGSVGCMQRARARARRGPLGDYII